MKILLFYGAADQEIARRLAGELTKHGFDQELLPLEAGGGENGGFYSPAPAARLRAGSHIIAAGKPDGWAAGFVTGFSAGSGIPVVIFSAPETASRVSSSPFRCINDEASLLLYLEKEEAAWKRNQKKKNMEKARARLLLRGIPVSEEAMADCAADGSPETLNLFLKAGFSPGARNKAGTPLLNLAARKGNREMVQRLLKAGAGINQIAEDRGSSALMDGVMRGHTPILEDLIKAGADINIKSKDGQSALILAVGAGDEISAELLLKAGAAVDEPDSLGVSARKYALLFKKPGMIALFNRYAPGEEPGKGES
ncbi:MAG: ankyrin repeat domain-containing protein [Treponema sp.]|jgi:hypothetical protein|nr:ankyrin repeat domain-containing protein [Treponema sp.]